MTTPTYLSDDQEQDGIYNEGIQAKDTFYTPMAFTNTALPPVYSQFQPIVWQHRLSGEMDMTTSQSWDTNRIINNHGPVMFDWHPSPVEPWDMQRQSLDATSHNGQIMAFQTPQFNGGYQDLPVKVEKSFEPSQAWQPSYRAQETYPIAEVVPQAWNEPDMLIGTLPMSVEVESPGRASKRRRRSSTSTLEMQFAPQIVGSMQPSAVVHSGEHQVLGPHRHVPTTTFHEGDITPPVIEPSSQDASVQIDRFEGGITPIIDTPECMMATIDTTSIPLTPTSQASPILTPSVRVISDRREPVSKIRRGSNTVFKTQSANTKRGHYASEVWESHKPAIKRMYIEQGKPLREVIKTMEKDHNFPATQRMYKARFKQWGFVKNNTEKVVSQILRTKFERDAAGKLSQFTRNGKDVNLQNYLQRKGLTEYDLVDFQPTAAALSQVRCRTPPFDIPEDLRLPDRLRFQDTLVMSFKRAFLLWRQEEQDNAFGFQPSVFTWRVTDFPHLSSLIESARLIRNGDGAKGVAALNQAFWSMNTYLVSMDATASFYFFFHRQSRPWQEDARIALAVWKFLAAYASARNHSNHPLFHTFRLMYEVIQKEGVTGLRELLMECSNTVADELERAFGREHWLKDLIWHRCFPEKSKLRQMQLIRDLRDHGPTKKIVKRLY